MALPGITSVSLSADNGLDWSPDMIGAAAQNRRIAMLESRYSTTRSSSV
jgi:hypothetical protein